MASDADRPAETQPESLAARIQRQVDALARRAVDYRSDAPKGQRHQECFPKWTGAPSDGAPAADLGPYSRWLIAARLLARNLPGTESLESRFGAPTGLIDQIFGDSEKALEKAFKEAERYASLQKTRTGEREGRVFDAILEGLERCFMEVRGRIGRGQFLSVRVPIPATGSVVGRDPIDWFDHWLA